jgi:Antibiotic biosynthesis monooxygenase
VLPLLYVSRLDLAEDAGPSFAAWYTRRHAPDLVGAGFLSVSSFRAVRGAPGVCNLYELRDLGAFGPAYQQARAADDEGVRVGERASNQSLAVYEQVVTTGVADDGGTEPRWSTALLAPVITTLRFSVDAGDEEVLDWYRASEAARIAAVPGCISVRVGRQIEAGRPNVDRRRWSVFAEWANQASALRWADTETAVTTGPEGALGEVIEPSLHVLGRRSVLHHLHAWQA